MKAWVRLVAWGLWSAGVLMGVGDGVFYLMKLGRGGSALSQLPNHPVLHVSAALTVVFIFVSVTVGLILAIRLPRNSVGWAFLVGSFLISFSQLAVEYSSLAFNAANEITLFGAVMKLPASPHVAAAAAPALYLGLGLIAVFLLLLFPDGRLASPRWRPLLLLLLAIISVQIAYLTFGRSGTAGGNPFLVPSVQRLLGYRISILGQKAAIAYVFPLLAIPAAAASFVYRFAKSRGESRQQMKWFAAGSFLTAVALVTLIVLYFAGGRYKVLLFGIDASWSLNVLIDVGLLLLPVSVAIAIFKYRLYHIDLVINRAILLGTLALLITSVHVAVSVGAGSAIGGQGLSVAAMGFVALVFDPVRERTQRIANRLVYGERATPYEGLSSFSKQMTSALYIDEVLPRTAEAAGRGVGAERVRVRLFLPAGGERAALWPVRSGEDRSAEDDGRERIIPVQHGRTEVGRIEVSKRPGDPIKPEEEKLLAALAAQAGLALHNVALTVELEDKVHELETQADELRDSRRRLVTVELRVREQVEREITERVEEKLEALEESLSRGLLEEAEGLADAALSELRDVVRGVFPPILAEQGVLPALESQSRRQGVPVAIEAADGVRRERFDPNVETAIYYCCAEALKRTAHSLNLGLKRDGAFVEFVIRGPPFDPRVDLGEEALQGMADRVEALGGSLEVRYHPANTGLLYGRLPAG